MSRFGKLEIMNQQQDEVKMHKVEIDGPIDLTSTKPITKKITQNKVDPFSKPDKDIAAAFGLEQELPPIPRATELDIKEEEYESPYVVDKPVTKAALPKKYKPTKVVFQVAGGKVTCYYPIVIIAETCIVLASPITDNDIPLFEPDPQKDLVLNVYSDEKNFQTYHTVSFGASFSWVDDTKVLVLAKQIQD